MNPNQIPLWKQAPFVRLLIPLIMGIIIQDWALITGSILMLWMCVLFAIFLLYYYLPLHKRYYWRNFHALFLLGLVFFHALFINWNNNPKHQSSWFGHFLSQERGILVSIDEPLERRGRFMKTTVTIKAGLLNQHLQPCFGKMLLYIKAANTSALHISDLIFIRKSPQQIKAPDNPGAFDYQQYQARQKIYHQIFLSEHDLVKIQDGHPYLFYNLIYHVREEILSILKKFIHHPQELGIAEALLIGYKNDLDQELVQSYVTTGVVHIIAISGLHLGLIYMGLIWLFNKIPVIKNSRLIKYIAVVICLWFFAILTGASASVLRSAVMFTCIAAGKIINKNSSIENALAASAFILLCFNPDFLWDLGFQLSYLAIIGIVLFQKPIQYLLSPNNYLIKKLWEMISITTAAQIMTFPICLFHFHQFPSLFLISNLMAVPLSTMILFGEILLLVVCKCITLSTFLGILIEKMIGFLNAFISYLHRLPFSTIQNIYSDIYCTSVQYAILIFMILFILRKKKVYIKACFFLTTIFSTILTNATISINNQKKVVFYQSKRGNVIDMINGKFYYCYSAESENLKNHSIQKMLLASRLYFGCDHPCVQSGGGSVLIKDNLFQFSNRLILIINKHVKYRALHQPVDVDILYLSDNPTVKISELLQTIRPKTILFAASNRKSKVEQWKKECKFLCKNYYSMYENGAYVYEIK